MDNVKFDTKTVNVLKSFSLINPSMLFKEGDTITTVSPLKNIFATAKVPVNFTKRFAVYSLSRFLNTMSLFNEPTISVHDRFITIQDSSNNKNANYTIAEESTIPMPITKDPNFPEGEIKFTLSVEIIKEIERALGILNLSEISVSGDGTNLTIKAVDMSNALGDTYSVSLGTTDRTFNAVFKPEYFGVLSKTITNEYKVDLSTKGFAHFKAPELEYWIANESSSTFN